MKRTVTFGAGLLIAVAAAAVSLPARQADAPAAGPHTKLFSGMRWRPVGPLRARRTKALAGVPSQPFTLYIGLGHRGVWKKPKPGSPGDPSFCEATARS